MKSLLLHSKAPNYCTYLDVRIAYRRAAAFRAKESVVLDSIRAAITTRRPFLFQLHSFQERW